MKKRISKILIPLLIILCGILYFSIQGNLKKYSVYYAQHLPHHPDSDPVMAMVIDNLWEIDKPENQNLRYNYDGNYAVIQNHEKRFLAASSEGYDLHNNETMYLFNKKGTFYEFFDISSDDSYDFNMKNQKAKELLHILLDPIIDIQPSPPKNENFQWLFNLIHKKRFQ